MKYISYVVLTCQQLLSILHLQFSALKDPYGKLFVYPDLQPSTPNGCYYSMNTNENMYLY